jgi:hypothetical protein
MRTTLVALLIALLASTALTADRQLSAQFAGDWCLAHPGDDKASPTYRLGRCLPDQSNRSDSWLRVHADGFVAHETRCTVVQAAADKNSNFLVKFRCSGEGQTWTRNYWMSLQLVMSETEREP